MTNIYTVLRLISNKAIWNQTVNMSIVMAMLSVIIKLAQLFGGNRVQMVSMRSIN